jgi:hypothetical protein
LIIARATAGDVIWFKATIDRIADILALQGDQDSIDIRRSKAIGILAQPAQALQLLCQHQHDDWDGSAEPTDDAQDTTEDEDPEEEPTEDEQDEASFEQAEQDAESAARPDRNSRQCGRPSAVLRPGTRGG